MLDEDQGGQPAAERETTTTDQGQGNQARDDQGRFASQDEGGERQEGEGEARSEGERAEGGDNAAEGERQEEQRTEEERGKQPAWVQRRIDELTRKRHEEARRADELQAQLDRIQRAGRAPEGEQSAAEQQVRQDNPGLTEEQVRETARRFVTQERAAAQFNESCNRTFDEGKAKFPDFEAAVGEFRNLGGLPQDFLEDAIAAGNTHAVLYHLGRNLDEADRIMSMPARSRTAALVRLSDKLSAPPPPKPISRAAAPIAPVGGAGRPSAVNTDPDALSTAEWMRRRNAGEIR